MTIIDLNSSIAIVGAYLFIFDNPIGGGSHRRSHTTLFTGLGFFNFLICEIILFIKITFLIIDG